MLRFALFSSVAATILSASGCTIAVDAGCTSDEDCRLGRVCIESRCTDRAAANNGATNAAANNSDGNNGSFNSSQNNGSFNNNPQNNGSFNNNPQNNGSFNNNPQNNGAVNNTTDPDVQLCLEICDLLVGSCVREECDVDGETEAYLDELFEMCVWVGFEEGEPGCVDALKQEPEAREELERLVDRLEGECDAPELESFRCSELQLGEACDCERSVGIGEACGSNDDCPDGTLTSFCVDEENEPPFPDGYCVATGCNIDPDRPRARYDDTCGEENVCVPVGGPGDSTGVCFDGCFEHDECRFDYQCRLVGFTREDGDFDPIRVCLPECGDGFPCGENERCNGGRCEMRCSDDDGPGPSGRARCNALDFTCVPDPDGTEWCVMP